MNEFAKKKIVKDNAIMSETKFDINVLRRQFIGDKLSEADRIARAIEKQRRFDVEYLRQAINWGNDNSKAIRKKVGCIVVNNFHIISDGFNGTPSNFDNTCEDETNTTYWFVLHAEANAICKLASSTHSSVGATMYLTISPCKECSKLIYSCGVRRVVYGEDYRDSTGIDFLKLVGVEVVKLGV